MKRTHPDDGATPGSAALHRPAEERLPGHAAQVDRNILESLVVYRYTVRVADGRPVKTTQSPECATVTGYTAEEFAADPDLWIRMVAPEDRELVRQRVQEILAGREIPPIEHRIRRKDGALRWVCDTIILHRDDRGRLVSYDGIIQDITARQQWEEERLRVSEERYRSLFESSRDSIMTLAPPSWKFTSGGMGWSLVAGIVGAAGAFGVLLAFGAKGTPAVVMSIVFAGAPVVNAVYSLILHPPAGGWKNLPWPFVLGIALAATGGCLVSLYKPAPAPPPAKAVAQRPEQPANMQPSGAQATPS